MNKVQLYIDGELVSLFKDETITVNDSIQNVKDIAKVYTSFTFDFTLPANKANNKIFSHYYNADIVGGFDARIKVSSEIHLNWTPYKTGYISLTSVLMKEGKPYAYKVGFVGSTVTLKDLFGKDKLAVLTSLNSLNFTFDSTTVRSYLERSRASFDILVPLITHTDRLYYDSSTSAGSDGNLYYASPTQTQGVMWDQLKPALRVHNIVEAIETKYGISFSTDFLDSSNASYHELFMWLHRNKGGLDDTAQVTKYYTEIDDFDLDSIADAEQIDERTLEITDYTEILDINLTFNTASGDSYDVRIYKDGVLWSTISGLTGNNILDETDFGSIENGEYTVEIAHTTTIAFTKIEWYVENDSDSMTVPQGAYPFTVTASTTFNVAANLPNITVVEFLQGLFKMFNLTAYVETDGTIKVETLDSYYAAGSEYDISKYVEAGDYTVGRSLPYKRIDLKYKDTKSFLASYHNTLFGYEWGSEEWDDNTDNLVGGVYTVELPFSHFKYERLIDINTGSQINTQWGYGVDASQSPWSGPPLLFYPILHTGTTIAFRTSPTACSSRSTINMPSNSLEFVSATSDININFRVEANEYTGDQSFTGTLFAENYTNYISDVFDPSNRLYTMTAYLPNRYINNIELNDVLIIWGRKYKINSIKVNLQTGKTDFELLNN